MKFNFHTVAAILRKDLLSLYPVVLLATVIFGGDIFITKLELMPSWESFRIPMIMLSSTLLIISVFQLDAPVSLVDDWLCRPVPKAELLAAKLCLVFSVLYVSRVIAIFFVDLALGYSLGESFLEAVLLQDVYFQLLLPVLLFTAVVTSTLVQAIGALIALFVAVFMIPTPFIQPPGPLQPGIGEGLGSAGMDWIMMVPMKIVPLLMVALCFWLLYWKRRILQARLLLLGTTLMTLFFFVLPMWLLSWDSVYSLQAATLAQEDAADADIIDGITLRKVRACFPATRLGDLDTDLAFGAARQFNGLNLWTEEDLRASGPDALTFLTGIEVRGLPLDWRVKLNYVRPDYTSADGRTTFSLRPPVYITDSRSAGRISHAWVLPQDALKALTTAGEPTLELNYWLTLLKPQTFQVPLDGMRHRLQGLGYCTADLEALNNLIRVDCFSTTHLGQLSAELAGISPSRVYGPPEFSPGWTQITHSRRYELLITSPGLSAHDYVTVTAWQPAGYMKKSLVAEGILGDARSSCPLPGSDSTAMPMSRWSDSAPHETLYLSVDEGVQLEVLDFGGEGTPILMVPGLGATAHGFDTLAPRLAEHHHVFAMTRRGAGASTRVDFGYDTVRLSRDIIGVMDALELPKALIVGASIAGEELSYLGGHFPQRLLGLVYLDAAYNRDSADPVDPRIRELNASLPPEPPIRPEDMLNYASYKRFQDRRGGAYLPEGELIAFYNVSNPYLGGVPNIDPRIAQAIEEAIGPPDYAAIEVPALAIYAIRDDSGTLPYWYDQNDAALMTRLAELGSLTTAYQRQGVEQFRAGVARGKVVEIEDAEHAIYLSNPEDVLREIETFTAENHIE